MTAPEHRRQGRPEDLESGLRSIAPPGLPASARRRHLESIASRAEALGPAEPAERVHAGRILDGRWYRAAAAVAALALTGFLGVGGVALAAQDALPGDRLYTIKTATEQLGGVLRTSPQALVDHYLARSERRVQEVEALLASGRNGSLITATLDAHRSLLAEAAALAEGEPALEARVAGAVVDAANRFQALLGDAHDGTPQHTRWVLDTALDQLGEQSGSPSGTAPRGHEPPDAPPAPNEAEETPEPSDSDPVDVPAPDEPTDAHEGAQPPRQGNEHRQDTNDETGSGSRATPGPREREDPPVDVHDRTPGNGSGNDR